MDLNKNGELASSESSSSNESDDDYIPIKTIKTKKKKNRLDWIPPEVSAALDRTNVSHRNATFVFVVAAVVSSLGMNIEDVKLNRETVRASRINFRTAAAKKIQNDFIASVPLTVHWDGKLFPDLVGSGK